MRTCKKCGTQFPENYNFCSKCGEKYTEQASPVSPPAQTNNFLKILPLALSILGFIVAWESDWVFGLIACIGSTVYAYSRYNTFKTDFDKISLIVSGGASILIILLMLFL